MALVKARQPLPDNTEIFTSNGKWERLDPAVLRTSANLVPNMCSETEPFWLFGWKDLWERMRIPSNVKLEGFSEREDDG